MFRALALSAEMNSSVLTPSVTAVTELFGTPQLVTSASAAGVELVMIVSTDLLMKDSIRPKNAAANDPLVTKP